MYAKLIKTVLGSIHTTQCAGITSEIHVVVGDVGAISALSHRITASPAILDESPAWFVSTSSTLCPTAAVHSSALRNPVRHPTRYRSSGRPSDEATDRGPPLSLVNTYALSRIGSAISVGRSAVKAPSSCAWTSVPWIILICTNSVSRRRALSPSQASLTTSRARRMASLSASGPGSEESRSHTTRVSLIIGGTTICGSGGERGRDGGSLRLHRVDGVVPTARPSFRLRQ